MKNNIVTFHYAATCLIGLLLSGVAFAQGISIEYATSKPRENTYVVDAKLTFEFDDEVLNALKHGVSLDIKIIIRLKQERKWLWDKLIKEDVLNYQLQYHPLSTNYLATDIITGKREQFQTLDEALAYLGSVKNHSLIDKNKLNVENNYVGLIKAELNIESLPPPLQPVAYVSSEWQLESQWYEWVIRQKQ